MLIVDNIHVMYQQSILALRGVTLRVPAQGIVTLLGANGAGKSTTMKAISGLLASERGRISQGSVTYGDQNIDHLSPVDLVNRGLVQVMEGRRCFEHLTVEENLLVGAYSRSVGTKQLSRDIEQIYDYFPRLKDRRSMAAGYTSGGEQQMLAIGRALMAKPKMILLDEPSMGLAPRMVAEIFQIVKALNTNHNVTFLLAEQNAAIALKYADYGYVLENGRVVMEGAASQLVDNEDIKEFYLGISGRTARNYREVTGDRRAKKWVI
jgi:branched-chain amino acid transport system ATP-binding protein